MDFSIIIVSHNRKEELKQTLDIINLIRDKSRCEIIVHLDGCSDGSSDLVNQYLDINWSFSDERIGASPSRNIAFNLANGDILIGLDDDSHPIGCDFFDVINEIFLKNDKVGILAMEEIRIPGWQDDELGQANSELEEYLTNEFIGCGFAIRREVYSQITGFPIWMTIYGEEACVSIEVLNINYKILFSNRVRVIHRLDRGKRKAHGLDILRFRKQIVNTAGYYIIYHPNPLRKIPRLLTHNFLKYALINMLYFTHYFRAISQLIWKTPFFLKHRSPVKKSTIEKIYSLPSIRY